MQYDEGNSLKSQDNHVGLRALPRNSVECGYHWADADNQLITRWDNTPHFPDLPGFPDHIHDGATGQVTPGQPMSIFAVLNAIAGRSR